MSSKKSAPDKAEDDILIVNGHTIKVVSAKTPAELPWAALGVQVVIESTGLFTEAEKAKGHLTAGARRSSSRLRPRAKTSRSSWASTMRRTTHAKHHIISNASCTTNCLAPLVHVLLKEGFGIEEGLMTTIHAYTATQKTVDAPSKERLEGGRSAAKSISFRRRRAQRRGRQPRLSGSEGKLTGMSFRVPTSDRFGRRFDRENGQGDVLQGDRCCHEARE